MPFVERGICPIATFCSLRDASYARLSRYQARFISARTYATVTTSRTLRYVTSSNDVTSCA